MPAARLALVARLSARLSALVALPVLVLAACASAPFPYADPALPHRGPDGFRNIASDARPGGSAPWYEVLQRRWRGDFKPSGPPEGGYEAFAERWRQLLKPSTLEAAAASPTPQLAWLGHAGLWLQAGGQRVLIDPQLSSFAGPVSWLASKRLIDAPIAAADLPPVDLLLITHSHYDHLDIATLKPILARHPQPRVLVPLGLKKWMQDQGARQVEELDWWEQRQVGPLTVRLLPAQHWSRRGLSDTNQTLWGGWDIAWPRPGGGAPWRLVHTGDTGYNEALYRQIGERLGGPVDLVAVPIGAYEPREFMRAQHNNPDEAVRIARLLNARRALGIHWGTFEISHEPLDQPPRDVAAALKAQALPPDHVWLMKQGEVRALPVEEAR